MQISILIEIFSSKLDPENADKKTIFFLFCQIPISDFQTKCSQLTYICYIPNANPVISHVYSKTCLVRTPIARKTFPEIATPMKNSKEFHAIYFYII